MTSDTELLERSLRHAVSDVTVSTDFTDRVLRGGRRRRFRRRAGMVTVAAAVTALVGGLAASTSTWLSQPDLTVAAEPRMNEPTRGDLANDTVFVNQVLSTWRAEAAAQLDAEHYRGADCWDFSQPAHVYWAGDTPVGPAALVLQPSVATPATCQAGATPEAPTWIGLVSTRNDVSDNAQHVLAVVPVRDRTWPEVFAFGPQGNTLLVTEASGAKAVSPKLEVRPDGTITRQTQRLDFRDGVAVVHFEPGQYNHGELAVIRELPNEEGDIERQPLWVNVTSKLSPGVHESGWNEFSEDLGGIDLSTANRSNLLQQTLEWAGMTEPFSPRRAQGTIADWMVFAPLPDGRTVGMARLYADSSAHLYAVLFPGDRQSQEKLARGEKEIPHQVVYGGKIDMDAGYALQRLPDHQGWLVAGPQVTLRYRIGSQPWVDVRGEAAVLPATATHVEITKPRPSGTTIVVPLT